MSEDSKLAAFLLALQTSNSVQKRFRKDPKKEMQRFGLAPATVQAVLAVDTEKIWATLVRSQHIAAVTGVPRGRRRRTSRTREPEQIAEVVGVPKARRKRKAKRP